jgi:hypothetical protein
MRILTTILSGLRSLATHFYSWVDVQGMPLMFPLCEEECLVLEQADALREKERETTRQLRPETSKGGWRLAG